LIYNVVEETLVNLWKVGGFEVPRPFPRMSYDQAMAQYGSDKPEMRLPRMHDAKPHFTADDLAKLAIHPELPFVAFRVPGCGTLSRKDRDELKPVAIERGAKVFDDAKALEKHYPQAIAALKKEVEWTENDLLVLVGAPSTAAGEAAPKIGPNPIHSIYTAAGALRLHAGQKYAAKHGLLRPDDFRFLWVLNFPMFEWDEEEKRFVAAHHPFTSPTDDTWEMLESNPGAVKAKAYDIVLNGTELGSGSIRIHRKDIQSRIFTSLGMSEEQARQRFGFFLDALEYGTPPHGGIALGLDRIIMILAGENSIREVIAFPKTAKAFDLMCEAPTTVSPQQLRELGIALKKELN
jgi:aspartyl-tRNA synthetase